MRRHIILFGWMGGLWTNVKSSTTNSHSVMNSLLLWTCLKQFSNLFGYTLFGFIMTTFIGEKLYSYVGFVQYEFVCENGGREKREIFLPSQDCRFNVNWCIDHKCCTPDLIKFKSNLRHFRAVYCWVCGLSQWVNMIRLRMS